MPLLESSADVLREARRVAGMTQVELARRARVTQSVISSYESGRRQPSLPVLLALLAATGHALEGVLVPIEQQAAVPLSGPLGRRVRRRRERIRDVAASYGASNVRVVGSVARGDERFDSDLDLLVDLAPSAGLFALGRLRRELEDLLGVAVDLIPADGLEPEVRDGVEADLVVL